MPRSRILKVFCPPEEQARLAEAYPVVEGYGAFVVVEVPSEAAKALAARYPVEDLTDRFAVQVGERLVDTSRPRIAAERLPKGPHHYLVQFVGPIKEEWPPARPKAGGPPR